MARVKTITDPLDLNIKSQDVDQKAFSRDNLQRMKEAFPGVDNDTLVRYLIARKNDFEAAKEMLENAEKWRAENWPISKASCINEIRSGRVYVRGKDKEGRVIIHVAARKHDPGNRNMEETGKSFFWFCEHAIKQMAADGDVHSKYVILIDRTNHSGSPDIEFMKYFSKLFQDQYPERVEKIIVYPSGVIFSALYNVIKWFMDPVTREKVWPCNFFYGVQQCIADEHIPTYMGQGPQYDQYEFNADDFEEPYNEEELSIIRAREEAAAGDVAGGRERRGSFCPETVDDETAAAAAAAAEAVAEASAADTTA